MKKILLLLLILLFGIQACVAQEVNPSSTLGGALSSAPAGSDLSVGTPATEVFEEEDIDKYFIEETDESNVAQPLSVDFERAIENPETTLEGNLQDQSINQNFEIQGYLEFNDVMQESEPDAIELEPVETAHVNFSEPKRFGSKSLISSSKKPMFYPIQDELSVASKFATQEYSIKPVSAAYVQKKGNMSFGTMYDSALGATRVGYSTGVFTKLEGKYFALKAAFSKSTNSSYDSYSDRLFFIPELKLTKRLSLLDVMRTDVYQINKSNEIVLRYTPHLKKYADDVEFEVGAGQFFFQDTYVKSSIRFSTTFKL